ncbi:hypothetical protein CDL12_27241 [Handroanthus impetiginosus]|uniref:Uncharacterized protein n=1 Tax=Handroanthus impetiginosus TaxID=429701 RepID=A0A2G9G4L8_9LAMI|nr:hypothetical protein CDL12_27241 [Handroanthus impetiginosus]
MSTAAALAEYQNNLSYAKERNEIPSRAELFEKCFSKNGVPSGPEVEEVLNEIKDRASHLPEGSKDTLGPNDLFGQVIGERSGGRILMGGFGVT